MHYINKVLNDKNLKASEFKNAYELAVKEARHLKDGKTIIALAKRYALVVFNIKETKNGKKKNELTTKTDASSSNGMEGQSK